MYEIVTSTPKALDEVARKPKGFELKYPWDKLTVGKSFGVPDHEHKLNNLRSYVTRMGHKYGKKFRVIHHVADKIYEVACLKEGLPIIPEGKRVVKKAKAENVKIVDGKFVAPLPEGWGLAINETTPVTPFPEKAWVKE